MCIYIYIEGENDEDDGLKESNGGDDFDLASARIEFCRPKDPPPIYIYISTRAFSISLVFKVSKPANEKVRYESVGTTSLHFSISLCILARVFADIGPVGGENYLARIESDFRFVAVIANYPYRLQ